MTLPAGFPAASYHPPVAAGAGSCAAGHEWGGCVATARDGEVTVEMARYCRRIGCGARQVEVIG